MLELYQFELSQFSEKIRLVLDYKGLEYKKNRSYPRYRAVRGFQNFWTKTSTCFKRW